MAQSVKLPTLGFDSSRDPTVCKFELLIGLCADSVEPAWASLSPYLSLRFPCSCCLPLSLSLCQNKEINVRGAWVVQSVNHLTSTQVRILLFVSSSSTSGSVLTAQSLEPASDSVSPSLSAPPLLTLCLSLSLSQK